MTDNPTENWNEYIQNTTKLMQLKLTPEYLPGVVKNFNSLAEIATLVTEFELPDDIEIAPIFKP
ncbi:MAG: hypothetical protein Tsb0014_07590 [Pleurocapsa sp.]